MSPFPEMKTIAAILLLLAAAGCGSPEPAPLQSRGARVLGVESDRAEDPVTGKEISKEDAVKREYKGRVYYFESSETAAAFDRDPMLYAVGENVPLNVK